MGRNVTNRQVVNYGEEQQVTVQSPETQRIIYLSGDVSEQSINAVNAQLINLASQSDKPINLVISTYGGSVHEMFGLYDTIKFLSCPVHTTGLGKVMSAGVLLLASGEKGKRLIGPSTRVMIHSVSSWAFGNIFDMENLVQETKQLQLSMTDALVNETNMSKEQLTKLMKSKTDTYLSASECIKLGIADKIMGNKRK